MMLLLSVCCIAQWVWRLVLFDWGVKHAGSADTAGRRRERADTQTPFWVHESCSWRRRKRSYLIAYSKHKSHTQTKWERSWRTRKCALLCVTVTCWGQERGRAWTRVHETKEITVSFATALIRPLFMCFIYNIHNYTCYFIHNNIVK